MERLTRTEVELEVGQNTSLVMELREENSVITHTDLFYHKTYSQLVRLLLNFICSQVSKFVLIFENNFLFVKTSKNQLESPIQLQ